MCQEKNGFNIYVLKIRVSLLLEEILKDSSINMIKIIVGHWVCLR